MTADELKSAIEAALIANPTMGAEQLAEAIRELAPPFKLEDHIQVDVGPTNKAKRSVSFSLTSKSELGRRIIDTMIEDDG